MIKCVATKAVANAVTVAGAVRTDLMTKARRLRHEGSKLKV